MKTILRGILTSLAWIAPALAAAEVNPDGNSLLITLFLGFGALIVVFQLIPSLILFGSMVKGVFSKAEKEAVPATKKAE